MEQDVWRPRKEHLFPIALSTGIFSKAFVFFKLISGFQVLLTVISDGDSIISVASY